MGILALSACLLGQLHGKGWQGLQLHAGLQMTASVLDANVS